MNLIKKIKKFDKSLTIIFIFFLVVSILSVYTTSFTQEKDILTNNRIYAQLIFIFISFLTFILTSIFDYKWFRHKVPNFIIFIGTSTLLLIVLFTPEIANVHRWIKIFGFQLQPSEFAKISLIINTAAIFAHFQGALILKKSSKFIYRLIDYLKPIVISCSIAVIYLILILLQPSGGIALLILLTYLILVLLVSDNYTFTGLIAIGVFCANMTYIFTLDPVLWIVIIIIISSIILLFYKKASLVFFISLVLGLSIIPTINLIWNSNIIKDYQRNRIEAFINPDLDPNSLGLKFQQKKALNQMIGSGIIGKGFLKGEKRLNIATPDSQTDFAYTVFIEENGLLGAIFFHLGFIILIYKSIEIFFKTSDYFGKNMIIGIIILIFNTYNFSVLINTNILFNTGIPTPFLSYGGSALISIGILIGFINSIKINE